MHGQQQDMLVLSKSQQEEAQQGSGGEVEGPASLLLCQAGDLLWLERLREGSEIKQRERALSSRENQLQRLAIGEAKDGAQRLVSAD